MVDQMRLPEEDNIITIDCGIWFAAHMICWEVKQQLRDGIVVIFLELITSPCCTIIK